MAFKYGIGYTDERRQKKKSSHIRKWDRLLYKIHIRKRKSLGGRGAALVLQNLM